MMNNRQSFREKIKETVTSWPGVEAGPGSRGEFAFKIGRHEIGHLHGDRLAHFSFSRETGAELREHGRVGPHPVNPKSPKLGSRQINDDNDMQDVIALMRMNYDRITGDSKSVKTESKKS